MLLKRYFNYLLFGSKFLWGLTLIVLIFVVFGKDSIKSFLSEEFSVATFIPWFFTIGTTIMYFIERRKNSKTSIACSLQGFLMSIESKRQHHLSMWGNLTKASTRADCFDEYKVYSLMVLTDYESLVQQVTGHVESLEVDLIPIDSTKYTDGINIVRPFSK